MTERKMRLGLSIRGHGYHPAAWRHPDVPADGTLHVEHYVRSAQIAERGKLGFNAKFLIETGEEVGSPGLQEFCTRERARLKADVLIASDGPRLSAQIGRAHV